MVTGVEAGTVKEGTRRGQRPLGGESVQEYEEKLSNKQSGRMQN